MDSISRLPGSKAAKLVIRVVGYACVAFGLSLLTVEIARFLYWTLPLPLFHVGYPSRAFDPERHLRLATYLPGAAVAVLGWVLVVWSRKGQVQGLEPARPWRYVRAVLVDKSSGVLANAEKQNYTVVPETVYYSMRLACDRCRGEFWFSANEQKVWYEKLGFWIDSIPNHCVQCRRMIRLERSRRSGAHESGR